MTKIKKLLFLFLIIGGTLVFATADDTELTQVVNSGSLHINAPTSAGFTAVDYSFSGQTSANNALGTINVKDLRGSGVGWSIDITGEDWSTGVHSMDYNGNGTTTGQLSIDIGTIDDVRVNAGDESLVQWTMGTDDAFDSGTSSINLVTVTSSGGDGDYDIANTKASQFLPPRQKAGSYTMTLTYTVS